MGNNQSVNQSVNTGNPEIILRTDAENQFLERLENAKIISMTNESETQIRFEVELNNNSQYMCFIVQFHKKPTFFHFPNGNTQALNLTKVVYYRSFENIDISQLGFNSYFGIKYQGDSDQYGCVFYCFHEKNFCVKILYQI